MSNPRNPSGGHFDHQREPLLPFGGFLHPSDFFLDLSSSSSSYYRLMEDTIPKSDEEPGRKTAQDGDDEFLLGIDVDVDAAAVSYPHFYAVGEQQLLLSQHDNLGLKITSGSVTIHKDEGTNMIGISIGGGAPNCPCLYIVQVFDNTPAAKDGTLQSGDELTSVNNQLVKGKTKVEVAKMIQSIKGDVTIGYNKLHADAAQGKSLDIILKKVKHRLVENMSSATADALGLSRAILCNDGLVKKLGELERTESVYRGLVEHVTRLLRAYLDLLRTLKTFAEVFAHIGVREPQPRASLAFTSFADYHRAIEKRGLEMIKTLKPVLSDLGTYLTKAIPDTRQTVGRYADAKWEYLSFCLKVKEMDDEEFNYASVQEPLYRVETGNYEYRLVLRCRQEARARFAQLRSDVGVKLELLDNKHVQDTATQLQRLAQGLADFYSEAERLSKEVEGLFPVEVDLSDSAFIYDKSFEVLPPDEDTPESTAGGDKDDDDPPLLPLSSCDVVTGNLVD